MASSRVARRALLGVVIVLVLVLVTSSLWLKALGAYLVRGEQPQRADVILVIAGDWSGQRILTGAELARQGYAPKVWVSGPMELYGVNEAALAINYAVEHGYPKELFEPKLLRASSTRSEAKEFKREFDAEKVRRVILVTSNYHTRRAASVFRSVLGPEYQLSVVSAPCNVFHPDDWWKHREDRKTFYFEWSKTLGEELGL